MKSMGKVSLKALGYAIVLQLPAIAAAQVSSVPPPPLPPPPSLVDPDRPVAEYRDMLAKAAPYLAALKELDAASFVPSVQIVSKGKSVGKDTPSACKGKTVTAIVRYVEAPTRMEEFRGTLVNCQPSGIGVIRIRGGERWAGQVRGWSEAKRGLLSIGAGSGIFTQPKSPNFYRMLEMLGTPSLSREVIQAEAVGGMPVVKWQGGQTIWTGDSPNFIIHKPDLLSYGGAVATMWTRTGAVMTGALDNGQFVVKTPEVHYPELGIKILPTFSSNQTLVMGSMSGMPVLDTRAFKIIADRPIGALPAGTYRSFSNGALAKMVESRKMGDQGPGYLFSVAGLEEVAKSMPDGALPDIVKDPAMLRRAGSNVRNCPTPAFPSGFTIWWPGCVPADGKGEPRVAAYTPAGQRMIWSKNKETGAFRYQLNYTSAQRQRAANDARAFPVAIIASSFEYNEDNTLQAVGKADANLEDAMGKWMSFEGSFYGRFPHGPGMCKEEERPKEACIFDVGVRTDAGYADRYAAWKADQEVKRAEAAVKEAERQAQLELQRQQSAEAAERQRIADEAYRQQEAERRRQERLAQLEEEEASPRRNHIAEAILEVGQKFQQAAVENQRGWDEVNRINRQTEEYNRRQREMVQRQNEANAIAAQQRASASSQANAQLAQQRRDAEQRLAEARAKAAQARQQAVAPRPATPGRPMAPAIIGNEGRSMVSAPAGSGAPAPAARTYPAVREATFLCVAHPTRGTGYYYCWGTQDNRRHLVGPDQGGGWHTPASLNGIVGCPSGSGPRSITDGGLYWACGFGADGRHNRDAISAAQGDGQRVQLNVGTFYCAPGETACRRRTPTGH